MLAILGHVIKVTFETGNGLANWSEGICSIDHEVESSLEVLQLP